MHLCISKNLLDYFDFRPPNHQRGCVKMKSVEFVTFKLIIDAFSNKVIRLGLVGHWFSIKV
jgi:hypothetical protein